LINAHGRIRLANVITASTAATIINTNAEPLQFLKILLDPTCHLSWRPSAVHSLGDLLPAAAEQSAQASSAAVFILTGFLRRLVFPPTAVPIDAVQRRTTQVCTSRASVCLDLLASFPCWH
jgi:hypothetical protein